MGWGERVLPTTVGPHGSVGVGCCSCLQVMVPINSGKKLIELKNHLAPIIGIPATHQRLFTATYSMGNITSTREYYGVGRWRACGDVQDAGAILCRVYCVRCFAQLAPRGVAAPCGRGTAPPFCCPLQAMSWP